MSANQAAKNLLLEVIVSTKDDSEGFKEFPDDDILKTVSTARELYLLSIIAKLTLYRDYYESGSHYRVDYFEKTVDEIVDLLEKEFVGSNHDDNPKTKTQLIRAWLTRKQMSALMPQDYIEEVFDGERPIPDGTQSIGRHPAYMSVIPEMSNRDQVFALAVYHYGGVAERMIWVSKDQVADWNPELPDDLKEAVSYVLDPYFE